ncbi:Dimeric alpha-beta barrel [Penicillium chermesinum]|uniref:Dimeric alpha-beta barrel n=1 Tax=Penicillium chermesinum TaxID=63820 RepID=A0A9W9NHP4_9EURO|nr:Dimeric alpha-beta barrel [Penicillium chermesinum]KAJ5220057.1 Dimeric alpha-beta barrel [Penicillium chermesinum]KAJ6157510.1 Dimeric alpha-beta barrel [Penicillium chermesinum]
MLPTRFLRPATSLVRPFSCSAVAARAPSIRDVTNDSAEEFNRRQREFRENLEEARKRKEQLESQSVSTSNGSSSSPSRESAPTAPNVSNASSIDRVRPAFDAADALDHKALGSLAMHRFLGDDQQPESPSKRGPLSSLIYGTKEGQHFDKDIERSFSQVLARGKYVHSIVLHDVKPDKVDEYVELVGQWYPRMAGIPENRVNLVGSWRTQVGDNDTFVHIWEYQRYAGYHESLHNISIQPEFQDFDRKLKSLIKSKKTSLMQEFSFWPTSPPRRLGGLFELRSYTLHPGNLMEWENHWRRGLTARRETMEGVGAWFVQIGDLNTVHHLWQFANLEERRIRREQSWEVEGWAETVHKTVPLIQTMQSRILVPMPWSPVG